MSFKIYTNIEEHRPGPYNQGYVLIIDGEREDGRLKGCAIKGAQQGYSERWGSEFFDEVQDIDVEVFDKDLIDDRYLFVQSNSTMKRSCVIDFQDKQILTNSDIIGRIREKKVTITLKAI